MSSNNNYVGGFKHLRVFHIYCLVSCRVSSRKFDVGFDTRVYNHMYIPAQK